MHTTAKTLQTATFTTHVIAKYVPETDMPTKLGIYAKYLNGIYGRCICTTYKVTAINHATRNTLHVYDISLNKYGFHIANVTQTAKISNGQKTPQFFTQ